MKAAYSTELGSAFVGDSRLLLLEMMDNSIDLVITSPPFALQRQKTYGNVEQHEYVDWLADFGRLVYQKLKPEGSFVIDLGGAYQKGMPARSLHNFRVLLRFCDDIGFFLAEDFYWFNPSKLPSPIEWVNKRKIRAKDSVNTVWWFSKTAWPKADVSKVLAPYSDRMKKLIANPEAFYKPKVRPSGHDISAGFGRDNGGAIPSNWLQIPNTESTGQYTRACKTVGVEIHPARFPDAFPAFFVRFLTNPGDLVVDIFAGSNTTGMVAESEGRQWISFEEKAEYVAASAFRFMPEGVADDVLRNVHAEILSGHRVELGDFNLQNALSFSFQSQ